jgi:hypothetical protein
MRTFTNWLRRFVDCRRGVTAVEFAFTLPILLFFTLGITEFSTIFMAQNMLENATNTASREGKTGYVKSGLSREAFLLLLIQERIDKLMDPSKITMDTQVYKALNQVNEPEPYTDRNHNGRYDTGETFTDTNGNGHWDPDGAYAEEGYGNAGDVTVYTVSYQWKVMTPLLSEILGNNGIVTLSSRILVKNEPYGNG